jgi:lipoprotein NlpI
MHKAGLILLLLFLVSPVLMGPGAAHADGVALANAGHQAQLQGQWDEAIKLYGAALDAGDLNPKGRLLVMGLRANALGVRGRTEEALAGFDAVIAADPQNPAPYVGRGMIHLQRGEADLAIADDDAAIRIAPQDSFARANRAMAAFYLGKFAEAADDYAIVQANDPGDAGFLLWLHLARARAGIDDAAAFERAAAAIDPKDWPGPVVAYFRGRATADQVEAAAGLGSKAEQLQQGCDAGFYLGEDALIQGRKDEAKQRFAKVLADCDLYRSNFVYFSRTYGAAATELKRLP